MASSCDTKDCDLFNNPGNILIADQYNNTVFEISPNGQKVWHYGLGPNDFTEKSAIGVKDASRVGELTLIVAPGTQPGVILESKNGAVDNRVFLVDRCGNIIWQYGRFGMAGSSVDLLDNPVHAVFIPCKSCRSQNQCATPVPGRCENCRTKRDKCQECMLQPIYDSYRIINSRCDDCKTKSSRCESCRKQNANKCGGCMKDPLKAGSILITDKGNNRILRINSKKEILWSYPTNAAPQDMLNGPMSAEKLPNNRYLIADGNNNRCLEIDANTNAVVKVFTGSGTLGMCAFASRLPNGNTLLTDFSKNRIVEVDSADNIVWQIYTNTEYKSLNAPMPTRAVRLANGDTLISNQFNNQVIRVNRTGVLVDRYGLALTGIITPGTQLIGTNRGYSPYTTQLGLYAPYSAYQIGDYTGLTHP
jgi:hypothetical protein